MNNQSLAEAVGQSVTNDKDYDWRQSVDRNINAASKLGDVTRVALSNSSCDAIGCYQDTTESCCGMWHSCKQIDGRDHCRVFQFNNQTTIDDIETFEWTTVHQQHHKQLQQWLTSQRMANCAVSCAELLESVGSYECRARSSQYIDLPNCSLKRAQSERVKKVNGRGRRCATQERIETAPNPRASKRGPVESPSLPTRATDEDCNQDRWGRARHTTRLPSAIDLTTPLEINENSAGWTTSRNSTKTVGKRSAEEFRVSSTTTNRDADCHEASCVEFTGGIGQASEQSQITNQVDVASDGFARASVLVFDNQTGECAAERSCNETKPPEGVPSGCNRFTSFVQRIGSLTTSTLNTIRERVFSSLVSSHRPIDKSHLSTCTHCDLPASCCAFTNQRPQKSQIVKDARLINDADYSGVRAFVLVGGNTTSRVVTGEKCKCLLSWRGRASARADSDKQIKIDKYHRQVLVSGDDAVRTISVGSNVNIADWPNRTAPMMTNTASGNEEQTNVREQQLTPLNKTTIRATEIGNMSTRQQIEKELTGICNRTPSQQQIRQKHFSLRRSTERRSTHCSSSGAMTVTDHNCNSSISSGGSNYCSDPSNHQLGNHFSNQQALAQQANANAINLMESEDIIVRGQSGCTSSASIELHHKQTMTTTVAPKFASDQSRTTLCSSDQKPRSPSKPVHTSKPLKKRDIWGKNIEFLLAVIGFAVDLGNIWRFPYICYKNGGGAFLIPYTIMFILGGLPIFYLEMSLGQYFSSGCLTVWRRVCPIAKGIGYAMCMLNFYTGLYYNTVISWAVFFFVESFTLDSLPWTSCNNSWNEKGCRTIEQRKEMLRIEDYSGLRNISSPTEDYFNREVLHVHLSEGITDIGSIRTPLAIYLAIVFVCVYFAIWKGVRSTGKAVWITALLPYFVLIPLLVRGVLLEGSSLGIKYYLQPRWSKILYVDVWVEAAKQIYFALGPGFGTLMALSSYNKFNHNCRRDALIAAAVNYFASFISGLVIFAVLGYMATIGRTSIEKVATEGPGLVFQVYPEGLATMRFSAMWSVLFFLMVITLGIDSTFGGLESVITGLCDEYPRVLRAHRGIFIGVLIMIIYICSLPTTTYGGNYVIGLLESYGTSVSLLFIVTAETIVVCWIYGADKFCNNLKEMYGERPGLYWRICWKYISPTILILILSAACLQEWEKYHILIIEGYRYPDWAPSFGLLMTFSSICCVPIYAIYYLKSKTSGTLLERLKSGITPKGYDETDDKDHNGRHLDTDI